MQMQKTYQNKKVSYPQLFQTALDNLGMVSKKQLEIMAKSLIARDFPYFTFKTEIMDKAIENYIIHSNSLVTKQPIYGDNNDFLYTNGVTEPRYELIPCLWALFNYFPTEEVNAKYIFRGGDMETMIYNEKATRYVFYYISEDNLSKMPDTIKHSKYLNATANLKESDEKKFKIVNFYVTDRVSTADEIEKFDIPYEYNLAVLKTGDYRFAQPEKVIFLKDGKRIK